MDLETIRNILISVFFIHLVFYYYFKNKEIKTSNRYLDSERKEMFYYFNNSLFALLFVSLFVVFLPFAFDFSDSDYIVLYIVFFIFLVVLNFILSRMYKKLNTGVKEIYAIQNSSFGLIPVSKYKKGKKHLTKLEKSKIKANQHFNFVVRKDDLTVSDVQINKQYLMNEYKEFSKALEGISINPSTNLVYEKLTHYINSKAKYHGLKTIKLKKEDTKLILIQHEIYQKVRELNKLNVTLRIGQLMSFAKSTFDFQFLNFLDCLKTGKFNNDSLNYAVIFLSLEKRK